MEKSFINFYTANRMKHPCAIHSLLDKQKTLNTHSRISSKKYETYLSKRKLIHCTELLKHIANTTEINSND